MPHSLGAAEERGQCARMAEQLKRMPTLPRAHLRLGQDRATISPVPRRAGGPPVTKLLSSRRAGLSTAAMASEEPHYSDLKDRPFLYGRLFNRTVILSGTRTGTLSGK